jgi:YtkA-like
MRQETKSPKRRGPSRGALVGLAVTAIALGWLGYSFLGELAPPPATQRVGDLQISLYSTLTGRPRVGANQFEIKLRDPQGQPVSQAEVAVVYSMSGMGHGSRMATRPEGYGTFSTMLSFSMPGTWRAEVMVSRPGLPEVSGSFSLRVE